MKLTLNLIMTILEFSTVILFAIGGMYYCKIVGIQNEGRNLLAKIGVISCFIGGFPNACDKACWTFFNYDTWFNSTWMFFFVGIGYMCLFISAIKNVRTDSIALSAIPAFHKPMKYCSQLLASIGMIGFYITMYRKTKNAIGKKALLYFVTMAMTIFLIVFSIVGKFSTSLPNIIAQLANSAGYIAFITANRAYLKKL